MFIYKNILKITLSLLLGMLIGIEREKHHKSAGLRTTMLITLGATILGIFNLLLIAKTKNTAVTFDFARIIAYALASIGFLGSGVIIQKKGEVEGITTAGILWVSVITGLLIGHGYFLLGIITNLSVYFILKLKYLEKYIIGK